MPFDILGYQKENKDFYGDASLEDVAKDAYKRGGYAEKYPDYNSWKQVKGIDSTIQEDNKRNKQNAEPTFAEKIRNAVSSVAPAGFEDIPTSFVKGATLGYVPAVATPEDAGMGHKIATGVAGLVGMGTALIGPGKLLAPLKIISPAANLINPIARGAILGAGYGAARKPEEGENRLSNTWKDALIFGTFVGAGGAIEKAAGKILPESVGKLLDKINKNAELPAAERIEYDATEKAIQNKLGYVTSTAVGGGAGATEPAEDWKERFKNVLMGAGTFAGVHGLTSAISKIREEKDTSTPEDKKYLENMKIGARATEIIDEGLKTGRAIEEDFTPDHALTIIKDLKEKGIYTDDNIDNFKEKYPQLQDGLNDILGNGFGEKVKQSVEAIGNTLPKTDSTDRRVDGSTRKLVADMTPDERATALLTDHLTGQPNKRAYEEAERKPFQAILDVDSLKFVNDTYGHEAGNELLKKVGDALNRASDGKDNYHFHGDEFVLEGKTSKELSTIIEKAKQILKDEPLSFGGPEHTAEFSHGIAETMAEADKAMHVNKTERKVERDKAPQSSVTKTEVKPDVKKPVEKPAEEKRPLVNASEDNLKQMADNNIQAAIDETKIRAEVKVGNDAAGKQPAAEEGIEDAPINKKGERPWWEGKPSSKPPVTWQSEMTPIRKYRTTDGKITTVEDIDNSMIIKDAEAELIKRGRLRDNGGIGSDVSNLRHEALQRFDNMRDKGELLPGENFNTLYGRMLQNYLKKTNTVPSITQEGKVKADHPGGETVTKPSETGAASADDFKFKKGKDFKNEGEYEFTNNGEKWFAYKNAAPGSLGEWYARKEGEEFPKNSSRYTKEELIDHIKSGGYDRGHDDYKPRKIQPKEKALASVAPEKTVEVQPKAKEVKGTPTGLNKEVADHVANLQSVREEVKKLSKDTQELINPKGAAVEKKEFIDKARVLRLKDTPFPALKSLADEGNKAAQQEVANRHTLSGKLTTSQHEQLNKERTSLVKEWDGLEKQVSDDNPDFTDKSEKQRKGMEERITNAISDTRNKIKAIDDVLEGKKEYVSKKSDKPIDNEARKKELERLITETPGQDAAGVRMRAALQLELENAKTVGKEDKPKLTGRLLEIDKAEDELLKKKAFTEQDAMELRKLYAERQELSGEKVVSAVDAKTDAAKEVGDVSVEPESAQEKPETKGTLDEVGVKNVQSIITSEKHTIKDIDGKDVILKANDKLLITNNEDGTFHVSDKKKFDVNLANLKDIKGIFSDKVNEAAGGMTPEMRAKREREDDHFELAALFEDMGKQFEEIKKTKYSAAATTEKITEGFKETPGEREEPSKSTGAFSKVKDFITRMKDQVFYSNKLINDNYNLKNQSAILDISTRQAFDGIKETLIDKGRKPEDIKKDFEAISHWRDNKKSPITDDQKKLYRDFVEPIQKAIDEEAMKHGGDAGHIRRFAAEKGDIMDRLIRGVGGNFASKSSLRTTTGSDKKRVMLGMTDEQGNKKVISNKGGSITSWTKGEGEYEGKMPKSTPERSEWFDKQIMSRLDKLANDLDITHKRVVSGRGLGGNRMGVSYTGENLIKTKHATPEDVFLHEIGHQLDERFNIQETMFGGKTVQSDIILDRQISKATREKRFDDVAKYEEQKVINNELRALADKRFQDIETSEYFKKYVRKGEEKVAVMFQAYLHAPDLFKEVAPNTYKKFVDFLGNHAETKQILDIKPSLVYGKSTIGGKVDPDIFIDKNGKKWTIGDATIQDIEANTDVTYHKNALLNSLMQLNELKKANLAKDYLENIKTSPEFLEVAVPSSGQNIPEGYKVTVLPQLRGYAFPERIAETFDKFYKNTSQGLMEPSSLYQKVNAFLKNAIFFNPLIHVPNIMIHAIVNRGLVSLVKPGAWVDLAKTSMRAAKAVWTMNEDYVKALEHNTALLYSGVQNKNLYEVGFKRLGVELEHDKQLLSKVGQALGYANPAELVKRVYKFSSQATWFVNDVITLQSIYEEMGHGMSFDKAILETSKHIPNYRIPTRIMNSTTIAKLMNPENGITMFGNYHYGALKSYGEMAKSLLGKVPMAERKQALDKIAMLGLVTCVLYPALDELAKTLTGDEKAEARRAGAATFPYKTVELAKGQISLASYIQSVLTPSIGFVLGTNLYMGRDWTGRRVTPAQIALGSVAPVALAEKMMTGERPVYKAIGGLIGVSYRGGTDFEKWAHGLQDPKALTEKQKTESRTRNELVDAFRNKEPDARQKLAEAVRNKEINHRDAAEIRNRISKTLAQEAAHTMSLDQLTEGIEGHASEEERQELLKTLVTKFRNKSADLKPDERQRYIELIQKIRDEKIG